MQLKDSELVYVHDVFLEDEQVIMKALLLLEKGESALNLSKRARRLLRKRVEIVPNPQKPLTLPLE